MESCPLCDSFGIVEVDKPCYGCGLSLVEIADDKKVAVVPGHFLFDRTLARPPVAIRRLVEIARYMVLDLSQLRFLSSPGIHFLVLLSTAAKQSGLKLVFAEVDPRVLEVFRICRLHKVYRIVETVDEGLEALRLD